MSDRTAKGADGTRGARICPICGLTQCVPAIPAGATARCARCDARIAVGPVRPGALHPAGHAQIAAAVALAALILLIPANLFPILELEYLGRVQTSTVWGGCIALWEEGMWVVAIIVFLASMAIPFLKLAVVFSLAALDGSGRWLRGRALALCWVERIGRWSMLDVFLLAILVALIKLDSLSSARPGVGLFFFAGVVVLTMIATRSFDPLALWRELDREREDLGASPIAEPIDAAPSPGSTS